MVHRPDRREPGRHRAPRRCGHLPIAVALALLIAGLTLLALHLAI